MTVKSNLTKKIEEELSGRDLGRELVRKQMGEWFAESRSKKERFMKKEGIPKPITQEEIDEQVQKFLQKGGTIQKLRPFDVLPMDENDEDFEEEIEISDTNYGLRKLLTMKINEMRY